MSGSPPWQAAKILFTALKANSYSFLPSGPFFKNIKLLAQSHHFLLSSAWLEPVVSGQWPGPALQGQHHSPRKCVETHAQQGQCLRLQRALCVPFSYHLPLELLKVSGLLKTPYEGKCV